MESQRERTRLRHVQDNILFVTYYGYDETGKSTFFTSLGTLTSTGEEWISADWNGFSGGPCWGCSYSAPTPTSIGTARFKFDTPLTGTLTLSNGTSIPIQRQSVVGFKPALALQRTWHTTYGTRGVYYGNVLWINKVLAGNDGKFSGVIIGGSTARILVGGPVEGSDPYTAGILIDSSTNYYDFMLFKWGLDKLEGRFWTYRKTSSPSGSGLPLFGSKVYGDKISRSILAKGTSADETSKALQAFSHELRLENAAMLSFDNAQSVMIGDAGYSIERIRQIAQALAEKAAVSETHK